eukprot:13911294-Heterocapsa_arctica.AAC.1
MLQSTGVHAPFDGEEYHLLEHFQVGKYNLYQFPWLCTEATTNKSCGVSILLNRRFFSPIHICQTWNAPEGLHGRAGAIRVRHRCTYDYVFISLYYPPHPASLADEDVVRKLNRWLSTLLQSLPTRTMPCIGMDANAKGGHISPNSVDLSPSVGEYSVDDAKWAGIQLMNVLDKRSLCCVNTFYPEGAGPTWTDGLR